MTEDTIVITGSKDGHPVYSRRRRLTFELLTLAEFLAEAREAAVPGNAWLSVEDSYGDPELALTWHVPLTEAEQAEHEAQMRAKLAPFTERPSK